jgi:hypothetical protein
VKGFTLPVITSVTFAGLSLAAVILPKYGQRLYASPDPRPFALSGPQQDPTSGSLLTGPLKKFGARIIAVHTTCYACTLQQPRDVEVLFKQPDVLNIVVAAEKGAYRQIERQTPSARVVYLKPEDVKGLNPFFGPRLYVFDAKFRLLRLQRAESADIKKEVELARTASKL